MLQLYPPYTRTSTCFQPKSNILRPLSSLTPSLLIALSSLLPTPGVRLPHSVQQVVDQRVEERAGGGLGEESMDWGGVWKNVQVGGLGTDTGETATGLRDEVWS